MKLLLPLLLFFAFSNLARGNEKPAQIKALLDEVHLIAMSELEGAEPIAAVDDLLSDADDKTIVLTRENIQESLEEAVQYRYVIIIVENHTLVRITNLNDCSQSGVWEACMPYGRGLIQYSGELREETGYINQLIGVPDGQLRKMYLFR
ncbi:hypothetical protein [Roseimarinus sediminis]|uniref:hypothetical protein n=1 Tax=Roseimarinus sediminis TaxID=1610899 RepID=UPI003D19C01F